MGKGKSAFKCNCVTGDIHVQQVGRGHKDSVEGSGKITSINTVN